MKLKKRNRTVFSIVMVIATVAFVGFRVSERTINPQIRSVNMPSFDHSDAEKSFPFIQFEKNELVYPSKESNMEPVYEKLQNILYNGQGELAILHMGGSHVQGGAVGHRMRELFEDLAYGTTQQRGLMFPFRVAHTNSSIYTSSSYIGDWDGCRCAHNRHRCDWGMSGMVASTTDKDASFQTWAYRRDSSLYESDLVRLYVSNGDQQFTPQWDGKVEPTSVTFDSIASYYEWIFPAPVDTLKWSFTADSLASYVEVQGVYMGNSKGAITYNEIGVNGASTRSYLRCDFMPEQLQTLPPDLVFFGIGINDAHVPSSQFSKADFIQRYDTLVSYMKSVNPEVAIVFLTNNDSFYRKRYANKNGKVVQEAMYELAEKHQAAVWDLFEIMGGFRSIEAWDRTGLAKNDKIHFTRDGYYLQAELMYEAIITDFSDWMVDQKDAAATNNEPGGAP
ncbi:MAG: GDSL-type esterase/lipase family protein [Flavobacteriales bacterium]|nr:GDSL-type esterase/lipase family protein [Flavobacteriales bacterium]